MQNEGNGPWKQRPGLHYCWESNGKCTGEAMWGALVPRSVIHRDLLHRQCGIPGASKGCVPTHILLKGQDPALGLVVSVNSHLPLPAGRTDATPQPWGCSRANCPAPHSNSACILWCCVSQHSHFRNVCHCGWRGLAPWKDVGTVCAPGLLQRQSETGWFFPCQKVIFGVQQTENLHMASDSASATRHFSARCGNIFSPLLHGHRDKSGHVLRCLS